MKNFLYRLKLNIWFLLHRRNAWVTSLTNNFCEVMLRIPMNRFTTKYYGVMASVAMLEATEIVYEWMLMKHLGENYVVFSKETHIKNIRPAKQDLYAHFVLNPFFVFDIIEKVEHWQEYEFSFWITLKDKQDKIYAQIEKTIYIARKDFYKIRQAHAIYSYQQSYQNN
jgi:hypothetical protein